MGLQVTELRKSAKNNKTIDICGKNPFITSVFNLQSGNAVEPDRKVGINRWKLTQMFLYSFPVYRYSIIVSLSNFTRASNNMFTRKPKRSDRKEKKKKTQSLFGDDSGSFRPNEGIFRHEAAVGKQNYLHSSVFFAATRKFHKFAALSMKTCINISRKCIIRMILNFWTYLYEVLLWMDVGGLFFC